MKTYHCNGKRSSEKAYHHVSMLINASYIANINFPCITAPFAFCARLPATKLQSVRSYSQELRARKSGIRVQAVQVQEEELEEAAVNKWDGRDNENLKGTHENERRRKTSAEDEDKR